MKTPLYDPLFGHREPASPRGKTALAGILDTVGFYPTTAAPVRVPNSPITGKPMVQALAGGLGQPAIPVWVDAEAKICLPVLK